MPSPTVRMSLSLLRVLLGIHSDLGQNGPSAVDIGSARPNLEHGERRFELDRSQLVRLAAACGAVSAANTILG